MALYEFTILLTKQSYRDAWLFSTGRFTSGNPPPKEHNGADFCRVSSSQQKQTLSCYRAFLWGPEFKKAYVWCLITMQWPRSLLTMAGVLVPKMFWVTLLKFAWRKLKGVSSSMGLLNGNVKWAGNNSLCKQSWHADTNCPSGNGWHGSLAALLKWEFTTARNTAASATWKCEVAVRSLYGFLVGLFPFFKSEFLPLCHF